MGYLVIDHSNAIDKRGNFGIKQEFETASCKHCQGIIRIVKHQKEGGWCFTCKGAVCIPCTSTGQCTPFMKRLEAKVNWDVRRKQMFREYGF